ncbi:MAG: hypothetical protein ACOC29_01970 [Candidatus Sumerlaeota bacterium]
MIVQPDTAADEMVLEPSRVGSVIGLAIFLAIALTSFVWVINGHGYAWFLMGIGLVGALLYFAMLLPRRQYLKLDREGFICKTLFHEIRVQWKDVEAIGVTRLEGSLVVGFDLYDYAPFKEEARRLLGYTNDYAYALPSNYSHSARDLAAILTEWRARAVEGADQEE